MPTTINGVGTSYGGKRNVEKYFGVCESCRREVELSNYETKLWFTVLFIPLIPLGKKQIFNYCPACSRHGTMPLAQWESIKRNTVDEHRTSWNQTGDPVAAIQLLETYTAFRQFDEARELVGAMATRFPNITNVQLAIGQFWATVDQADDSERCFRRAYELEPTNPHARHALAVYCLQKDDPVGAERLLRQPPSIAAADNPQLHYMLGAAYHRQGRNAEALQTFRSVLQVVPQFAKNKEVRKLIRETELAVGEQESILPYRPFYRTTPFVTAAVILLLAAVFFGWNWSVARNRTLHIVNGYKTPITVTLDGGQSLVVPARDRTEIKAPEGKHHATIQREGIDPETVDFDVSSSFFDRYFKSPAFVLNPGGAAPLVWEQKTYMVNPGAGGTRPYAWRINQPFVTYPDLDYVFAPFPQTIQMKRHETIRKTRIDLVPTEPDVLVALEQSISDEDKLKFAETHLTDDPNNRNLILQYAMLAQKLNQADRVKAFLASLLDRRPIAIELHRIYQNFGGGDEEGRQLVDDYRKRLAADPGNAALMYLVARLLPRRDDELPLLDQAIAADPQLFYPKYAKANLLLGSGDFPAARALGAEVAALDPANPEAQDFWFKVRLANGEYTALENELRENIQNEPLALKSRLRLCYVLAASHRFAEIVQTNDRYQQAVASEPVEQAIKEMMAKPMHEGTLYLQRRLQPLLDEAGEPSATNALERFVPLLELGRLDLAGEALHNAPPNSNNGYLALCLSLAWRQHGKSTLAELWESTAHEWLSADIHTQPAAKLIEQPGPIDFAELMQLSPLPGEKAILLTALAYRCGDKQQAALQMAKKLNFQLEFPHYFLDAAIPVEEARN